MLKKGNEYLDIETGIVYRIYHISPHSTHVLVSSKREAAEFVLHTNPKKIEEIEGYIKRKEWVPNTPAAQVMYGRR